MNEIEKVYRKNKQKDKMWSVFISICIMGILFLTFVVLLFLIGI